MARMRDVVKRSVLLSVVAGLCSLQVAAAERVVLPGHVVPIATDASIAARAVPKRDDGGETVLTIVLRRNDEPGFRRDLAALYEPSSPTFRQWMSPALIAERYGPTALDYDVVERHFAEAGFRVIERSSNRMTLVLGATRAAVERTLDVALRDFVVTDAKGREKRVYANDRDPSLPADVAARVMAINGLSSLAQPRPLIEAIKKAWCSISGSVSAVFSGLQLKDPVKACEDTVTKCAAEHHLKAESLSDLLAACRKWSGQSSPDARPAAADAPVPWKDADGTGQVVAITSFSGFLTNDVRDTLDLFGYDPALIGRLSRVSLNGGAPVSADQSEVVLDASTVLMGAPGAQVVVYDIPFGGGAFQALFNRMVTDGASIISNSWAYCENETSHADVASIDAILATAAAAGISVFSAAGDSGSTCLNGSPNTIVVPAGSPHATAVGGTSLETGPGTTWKSATWWGATPATPPTGQGGFGVSRFFARPSWQNGFTASPYRSIPDLAFQSDPERGIVICVAALGPCGGNLFFGGTSYAAPSLAAALAKMNQAAGHRLGLLNPQVYPLGGSGAFNAPAVLGSDFAHVGLGTAIFNRLFLALTGGAAGPVSPAQSIVEVEDPQVAKNVGATHVVVKLRDASGNIVPGKAVSLSHNGGGTVTVTPPVATTSATNGAAIFEVRSSALQNVSFTATDTTDGIVLPTTFAVEFVAPPAAAGGIAAFPTTVANDGVATTTITITLLDAQGQPTPGKTVQLAQGGGRSVIAAPIPPQTNASGQIQFTATNTHAETVTYTAVVVTDGDVPVPGNAVVTWSGSAPTSCVTGPAPTAATGYAIAPFATGFRAGTFSFSNVNWGCSGASNPAFQPDGTLLIADFRAGNLYRLPPGGGAASSGNVIASPGLTIGQPVYGKDGRLYAARSATGAGFFSGAIHELDPATGAILRTLASGLACLSPLAVDPLSGDLFYTGTCFGAGSDDPRLYRLQNTASATPAIVTYATLPGTPNGAVTFAPDGTMFVATQYLSASPPVLRVSGTNQPQPPSITPIAGLASIFWVTVAETLANGAAKSLVFLATDNTMKLADVSVSPPTITPLIDKGMSSGVVGPDGCLYLSDLETVHKLTQANGACGFTPTNPSPAISLTPAETSPDPATGTSVTLTATLVGVPAQADVPITFRVDGPNGRYAMARTDASGKATLTYVGDVAGTDTARADTVLGSATLTSGLARVHWVAGRHTSFLTLNPSATSSIAGQVVTLTAAIADGSTTPLGSIAGVTIQFNVGGQMCNAVTNASGIATCQVTLPLTGNYTLTATFAGNAQYVASAAAVPFNVVAAPPGPCVAFDDVDATSPFCPSVEWIKNRSITLGCVATLYCPSDVATRLQMAAFMNRLGTTLGGRALFVEAATGAVDLDADPVVCQTADVATGTYERRAVADGSYSGTAGADAAFAADVVASFDAGATWAPLAPVGNRAFAPANRWGHVRAWGTADLAAAQSVRFGLWISRGGQPGGADLADGRCKLRVVVGNR
ncbi:MAG: hypothetical protein BroJett026_15340 [Betaproteobacteria bacterium]|nr:MAG: hypothetical protein BroJett026_15340 [Betaproteobacteria bacterium]